MVKREIFDFANQHKSALIFAAGLLLQSLVKRYWSQKL